MSKRRECNDLMQRFGDWRMLRLRGVLSISHDEVQRGKGGGIWPIDNLRRVRTPRTFLKSK